MTQGYHVGLTAEWELPTVDHTKHATSWTDPGWICFGIPLWYPLSFGIPLVTLFDWYPPFGITLYPTVGITNLDAKTKYKVRKKIR